jgi:hypothetical protein
MIRDWYFCASLRLPAEQIKDYLTLLAFLDGISDKPGVRAQAIAQLAQQDAVLQLHGLPKVLRGKLEAAEEPDLEQSFTALFSSLERLVPEQVAPGYRRLFGLLRDGQTDGLFDAVEACASRRADDQERQTSESPYLDLESFAAEDILLSVCLELARSADPSLAAAMARGADDADPFRALIDDALELRLGRHAHCLACEIAVRFKEQFPEDRLRQTLLHGNGYQSDLEPDALWLLALIELGPPGTGDGDDSRRAVVAEMLRFTTWERVHEVMQGVGGTGDHDLRTFLGPSVTPQMAEDMGRVLWQALLWEWLLEHDPAVAAETLVPLWRPRTGNYHQLQLVIDRFEDDARDAWVRGLARLAAIGAIVELRIKVRPGPKLVFPRDDQWMVFSPWLHCFPYWQRPRVVNPKRLTHTRFKGEHDWPALFRLIAAALVSVRVLCRAPKTTDEQGQDLFACFVLHAADVLSAYGFARQRGPDAKGQPIIAEPLEGFALAAHRIVTLTGCGVHAAVSPDRFLDAVEHGRTHADRLPREIAQRNDALYHYCFPEVLIQWVNEASVIGIDAERAARWAERVADVDRLHDQSDGIYGIQSREEGKTLLRELVYRYLGPGDRRTTPPKRLDWRQTRTEPGQSRRESLRWHRMLLIGEEPRVEELLDEAPVPSDPDQRGSDSLHINQQVALAVQRAGALADNPNPDQRLQQDWLDDLVSLVNRIARPVEFDRYVRLRLLELLDHPFLDAHPSLAATLFALLLEYGSVLVYQRLSESLARRPGDVPCWLDAEAPALALTRVLSMTPGEGGHGAWVLDAWGMLVARQRQEVAEAMLLRLLGRPAATGARAGVARLRRRLLAREDDRGFCSLAADTTHNDADVHRLAANTRLPQGTLAVRAAHGDLNAGRTWLYQRVPMASEQVRNIFAETPEQRNGWGQHAKGRVAETEHRRVYGLVITRDQIRGETKMSWNVGLREPVFQGFAAARAIPGGAPGELVVCPVFNGPDRDGEHGEWRYDLRSGGSVLDLNRLPIGWNRSLWLVQERSLGRPDARWRLGGEGWSVSERDWSLADWLPDTSMTFRPLDHQAQTKAVLGVDRRLRPAERGFLDLVLAADSAAPVAQVFAVVELEHDEHGDVTELSLGGLPGQRFRVRMSRFSPADQARISVELADLLDLYGGRDAARGLLLVVRINSEGDGLELVDDPTADGDRPELPVALHAPFDRRNIRWRALFAEEPVREVEQDAHKGWILRLEPGEAPPGFPDVINVNVPKGGMQATEGVTTAMVQSWTDIDQHRASVLVQFVRMDALTAVDDDMNALLERLENIERGSRFQLKTAIGSVHPESGRVRCLTREGLVVDVDSDSISFEPIGGEEGVRLGRKWRSGQVVDKWLSQDKLDAELDPAQLPDGVKGAAECEGVVTAVPARTHRARGESATCRVYWRCSGGYEPSNVHVENLARLRLLAPGARLIGSRTDGQWRFRVERCLYRLEALWEIDQGGALSAERGTYVGRIGSGDRGLVQQAPGRMVEVAIDVDEPPHLSGSMSWPEGLPEDRSFLDRGENNRSFKFQQQRVRRCCLALDKDTVIAGQCDAMAPGGKVRVRAARLHRQVQSDSLALVRREFLLQAPRARKPSASLRRQLPDWETWVRDTYLPQPEDVEGTPQRDGSRFQLDGNLPVSNPPLLPIAPGEGAFIPFAPYPGKGLARIVEGADGYLVSARRVPPQQDLHKIRSDLGVHGDQPIALKEHRIRLHFVQYETVDPVTGIEHPQPCRRFELGFGRTWLIPDTQLLYRGAPIDTAELSLFIGDLITQVAFVRRPTRDDDADLALSIEAIQPSQGTRLYKQARHYKIIHLLHLRYGLRGLEISRIEGFNDRQLDTARAEFSAVSAELDDADRVRLEARWPTGAGTADGDCAADHSNPKPLVVFGRLDVELFLETLGAQMRYSHVRLTFQREGTGSVLGSGEKVLLRAGLIRRLRNDFGLELDPLEELHPDDVGDDFRRRADRSSGLLMLRREFSVRQDLLGRLHQAGEDCLQGSFMFVQVMRDRNRVRSSISANMPPRSAAALMALLGAGEGRELANIADINDERTVLELRPGTFVELAAHETRIPEPNLIPGAAVQLRLHEDGRRIELLRAVFSDSRYLSAGRPVVVLPLDHLLDHETVEAVSRAPNHPVRVQRPFSLGDLPDVLVGIAPREGHPDVLNRDLIGLMSVPHPKVGALVLKRGGNGSEVALVEPKLPRRWWIGKLEPNETGSAVRALSLFGDSSKGLPVPWHRMGFEDGPRRGILHRIKHQRWFFHDRETGHWGRVGPRVTAEKYPCMAHSGLTGPVVFEHQGQSGLTLRYSPGNFKTVGLPVSILLDALRYGRGDGRSKAGGESLDFAVAGGSDDRSLWIQMAPGRLVELPLRLCVARFHHRIHSLGDLWPRMFAPGDKVELSLARSRDLFTTDRIILNWRPGPRGAFGEQRCLLPRLAYDVEAGSVTYGGGRFTLELPHPRPEQAPKLAYLSRENALEDATTAPCAGDVVLLCLNDKAQAVVQGAENVIAYPDRKRPQTWQDDPLRSFFADGGKGRDQGWADRACIADLIRAAGGSLPVTVVLYLADEHVLFFSRAAQKEATNLPEGALAPAMAQGLLSDQKGVLVRIGGGLTLLPMGRVVAGVPSALERTVVETLASNGEPIWLRRDYDGHFAPAWPSPTVRDLVVEPLKAVAAPNDEQRLAGILCRGLSSGLLHWLPARDCGWAPLDAKEARMLFEGHRKTFRARQLESGRISANDLPEVISQLDGLRPGATLASQWIGLSPTDPRRSFARATASGVLLACTGIEASEDGAAAGTGIHLEVSEVRRRGRILVKTVPLAAARPRLDLPVVMLMTDPEAREKRAALHRRRLDCLTSDGLKKHRANGPPDSWKEDQVEAMILAGVRDLNREGAYLDDAARAACAWAKKKVPEKHSSAFPEIDLLPAMAALCLLLEVAQRPERVRGNAAFRQSAVDRNDISTVYLRHGARVLEELGSRAVRSLHVEVLVRGFRELDAGQPTDRAAAQRVDRLRSLLRPELAEKDRDELSAYAANAALRTSDPWALAVANAVAAAIGVECDPDLLRRHSTCCTQIADLARSLAPYREQQLQLTRPLLSRLRIGEKFRKILSGLVIDRLDLVLLARLPELAPATENGHDDCGND